MKEIERHTTRAEDQVLGCMIGGAVGDALGYAVEFMSYDSIVKKFGEKVLNDSCGCGGFLKSFRRRMKERRSASSGRTRSGSRAGSSGKRWSWLLRTSTTTVPSNPSAEAGQGMKRSQSPSSAPPSTGAHSKMPS